MPSVKEIPIDLLVLDPQYCPRLKYDWHVIAKYTDGWLNGAKFPPCDVVKRNGEYVVLGGWYRTQSGKRAKRQTIPCVVRKLPENKWFLFALQDNIEHGQDLTVQERIAAAERLKAAGFDISFIAKTMYLSAERLSQWILQRGSDSPRADATSADVLKGAVKDMRGTVHEQAARSFQGTLANCDVRRTLDEMIAHLKCGTIDMAVQDIADRIYQIGAMVSKLIKKAKK